MIGDFRQLAERRDYPLLAEGIVDPIRVPLPAPVQEARVGIATLDSLGLREPGLEIVPCPSCGRAQVDAYALAGPVTGALEGVTAPLRLAVGGVPRLPRIPVQPRVAGLATL